MRIDAHQHFWDVDRFEYKWMPQDPASPLRRNYLPHDLEPKLKRNNFDGSVVVQAATQLEETEWLLDLAGEYPYILGVVGWVDLASDALGRTLDELQRRPKFKGVRHLIENEPDERWMLQPRVVDGFRELAARGIPYDLLIRPHHLPHAIELAATVPGLRIVIDHMAKPFIASGVLEPWAADIQRLAAFPQVYCKLSGMITQAAARRWTADDLKPYVSHVFRVFGPDRLMFGSDWPVCLLAGTWKQVLAAFTQALGPLPQNIREQLLGGTAGRFYGIRDSAEQFVAPRG